MSRRARCRSRCRRRSDSRSWSTTSPAPAAPSRQAKSSAPRPDGYNLLMSNTTPISLAPFMLDPQPYDSIKSFTHVALVATVPDVVMAHPSVPAKTLAELIAWIKAQDKKVFYGSGGVGSIGHILGETFKKQYGLNIEHVGYRGSAPMITDLIAGRLSFSFDTLPQNVPHIKAEKLRPLAVTSRTRSHVAPDIPTVVEAGMPFLVSENFIGVSAPAQPAASRPDQAARRDPDLARRSAVRRAAERSRPDGAEDVAGRFRRSSCRSRCRAGPSRSRHRARSSTDDAAGVRRDHAHPQSARLLGRRHLSGAGRSSRSGSGATMRRAAARGWGRAIFRSCSARSLRCSAPFP